VRASVNGSSAAKKAIKPFDGAGERKVSPIRKV
jgi:hypothetical protein